MTLDWPLDRAARLHRDREAVVCGTTRLTYGELGARARALSMALRALGLQRGERVAILAANCHRYIEAFFAVPSAGMSLLPLNGRLAPQDLETIIRKATPRVLLIDRDPGPLAGLFERVVQLPDEYEGLVAAQEGAGAGAGEAARSEDVALLMTTGGTTGLPKSAMLTHQNVLSAALAFRGDLPADERDAWVLAPPMFHIPGLFAIAVGVLEGSRLLVVPRFDPALTLDLIERERGSLMVALPTMLAAIGQAQLAEPRDLSSWRAVAVGGAPTTPAILGLARQAFPGTAVHEVFGATEFINATFHRDRHLATGYRGSSCGPPTALAQIRIVDADDEEVRPGEPGEVVLRGPTVMLGYWNDEAATAERLRGVWYHTGDVGFVDEGSYLHLVDRLADLIKTGGETVSAREVEGVLLGHPNVADAAVVGLPDPRWGEVVHAVVVARGAVEEGDLLTFLGASLTRFKVPKSVEFREGPLPRTGAGKLLKYVIRSGTLAQRAAREEAERPIS